MVVVWLVEGFSTAIGFACRPTLTEEEGSDLACDLAIHQEIFERAVRAVTDDEVEYQCLSDEILEDDGNLRRDSRG